MEKEPLLKDEEEQIFVGSSDNKIENNDQITKEEFKVNEKYQKEVINRPKERKNEKNKTNVKNTISIVVTLVLTILVGYLLFRTCLNFYYGFKYKDYVPSEVTEEK